MPAVGKYAQFGSERVANGGFKTAWWQAFVVGDDPARNPSQGCRPDFPALLMQRCRIHHGERNLRPAQPDAA